MIPFLLGYLTTFIFLSLGFDVVLETKTQWSCFIHSCKTPGLPNVLTTQYYRGFRVQLTAMYPDPPKLRSSIETVKYKISQA